MAAHWKKRPVLWAAAGALALEFAALGLAWGYRTAHAQEWKEAARIEAQKRSAAQGQGLGQGKAQPSHALGKGS